MDLIISELPTEDNSITPIDISIVVEPDAPIPNTINIKTRLVISYTTPDGIQHQSQTQGNYINLIYNLSVKNYVDVYGKLTCQADGTFFTPLILSYPNGIPNPVEVPIPNPVVVPIPDPVVPIPRSC